MVGPTLKGMVGLRETVADAAGRTREIVVDEAYLAKSIQDPMADIVKGYPPAMPSAPLKQEELKRVIELLKGLK